MERLKAVILVGGPGIRLRPLTNDRPKSIVPVLNRPVLEHTLAYLSKYGVRDVILTLNYLPDVIQKHFGDGEKYGVHLTYCIEEEPRGTAGAVKNAESFLDRRFFVLNGDIFTDINLHDMIASHQKNKAKATIALTWVDNPSAYGVVETDKSGRVSQFIEKPSPEQSRSHWINAGIYILEPEVVNEIPPNQHYMFERGLFPHLLQTGRPVYGFAYREYWLDMGNPYHYYTVNMDMATSKLSNLVMYDATDKSNTQSDRLQRKSSAILVDPLNIEVGCFIGAGVKIIGPTIIGKNCHIGDGVEMEKSILWDNVVVGKKTKINSSIVTNDTIIGENQVINNKIVTKFQIIPLIP